MFVTGDGTVYIITKGDAGPVALYRFPHPMRGGAVATLERVGPAAAADVARDERPTGADVSADGQWVVVRTTTRLAFYQTRELTAGRWREVSRFDLRSLGEAQGEGVAFGPAGAVYVAGEGEGKARGGTFARLSCALPAR